jgi:hypothetical protein
MNHNINDRMAPGNRGNRRQSAPVSGIWKTSHPDLVSRRPRHGAFHLGSSQVLQHDSEGYTLECADEHPHRRPHDPEAFRAMTRAQGQP